MVLHLLTQWEHLRLHSSIIIEMIIDDADIGILVNMVEHVVPDEFLANIF